MSLNRKDHLVNKAMHDLENGGAILTHDWLDDNNCSSSDAEYIALSIAHAIRSHYFNHRPSKADFSNGYTLKMTGLSLEEAKEIAERDQSLLWAELDDKLIAYPSSEKYPITISGSPE
ncbi:hypothetical protein [Pseudoalteromonas sp. NZS100]|uniref:hypothetical protein n=1 Tax=Pseudoalteromonas sp. NZS100 TaxID=2792046 RepID=UPI0018CFABB6|nr:hypothetical protein [Pseudoalteromonas sp. NZS100]MBH0066755.1 hypothetical protein [Pseudoalteromonas sp. NZS100]